MTFYPVDVSPSPGWFWGWDMHGQPCDLDSLAPLLFQPASMSTMRVISFQDVEYGVAFDFAGSSALTAYEIDAATLQIAVGSPISGPYSGFGSDMLSAIVLDATTMVVPRFVGSTCEFYLVERSGLSLSISGPHLAVSTNLGVAFTCYLDSSHLVRTYNPPFPNQLTTVVEVISVGGGSMSVVHTDTIAATWTATVDPSGLPSAMSAADFYPFHYDGAGTLYAYGHSTSASPTLFGPAICAAPFSIGGGIGTIGASTRAKDSQNVLGFVNLPAKKIGSTEGILELSTGARVPMWDDGSNMHYTLSSSATWFSASFIGHDDESGDSGTTQGDYLTGNVAELPEGTVVDSGPALVFQSGESISYTPITPEFLCPQFGTDIRPGASGSATRHGSNLGCQILNLGTDISGFGQYLLRAFKW